MASLKDKMYDLLRQVRTNLNDAVGYADETGKHQDFEKAFDEVKATEKKLKAVRAQVRTMMRKTKPAFQGACPHTNKVDVRVLQNVDGKRIVEEQRCTGCSKSFDLTGQVIG
jgi:hypothetical protein